VLRYRRRAKGGQMIALMGLTLIGLMFSALAIDFGYYFTANNALQSVADSAALAAATELYRDIAVDPNTKMSDARLQAQMYVSKNQPNMTLEASDVMFGFVNPTTKVYSAASFSTPTNDPNYAATGGYNAVRVLVRKTADSNNGALNTIMANLVGVHKMDVSAGAVAMLDQTISAIDNGGLRPIYACQAQFNKTMEDGVPENNTVRIYGDHVEVDGVQNMAGCPAMGSGNWGFADLRNCSPDAVGTSTINDWFATGFPGQVDLGKCYSTDPGNFISAISGTLDNLITNKTNFPIPLYNSWSGNGSNSSVTISGFAGFQITGYKGNGPASNRYIEGRFYKYACNKGCISGNSGVTSPGGAVVRLRLAYRS
jgi:Flp pilus assembly protein TadG